MLMTEHERAVFARTWKNEHVEPGWWHVWCLWEKLGRLLGTDTRECVDSRSEGE